MHDDGYFAGDYVNERLWGTFEDFFIKSESKTLLDFGCGKGLYWKNYMWHSNPELTCYDPAYEPFSKLPEGRFDMIMSKDCLEHIPMEQLEECVQWFYKHTNKVTVHYICETLATKNLPSCGSIPVTIAGAPSHFTVTPLPTLPPSSSISRTLLMYCRADFAP